jgi:hypothetical protein
MGKGEYSSRVDWKFEKRDEIDELGLTFNTMASKIEDTILTISKLNDEINKELKIGKEVQELFLPQDYMYEDYKIVSYYKPMREVSGDIYHYYRLTHKKNSDKKYTGIFFADASGHGVSAALVTTVTLLSVESIVSKSFKPNYVLQQLSNIVGNRFQSSFFATSVFFLITEKRKSSSNATPELADKKGKRFCILQEPEDGEEIKVGLFKELTGQDRITARPLYGNNFEFTPQFKLCCTCNKLPEVGGDDDMMRINYGLLLR